MWQCTLSVTPKWFFSIWKPSDVPTRSCCQNISKKDEAFVVTRVELCCLHSLMCMCVATKVKHVDLDTSLPETPQLSAEPTKTPKTVSSQASDVSHALFNGLSITEIHQLHKSYYLLHTYSKKATSIISLVGAGNNSHSRQYFVNVDLANHIVLHCLISHFGVAVQGPKHSHSPAYLSQAIAVATTHCSLSTRQAVTQHTSAQQENMSIRFSQ